MLKISIQKLRSYLLRACVIGLVLISIFWAGCHLFLPHYLHNLVQRYEDQIGYEFHYGQLSLTPLRLMAELSDVRLSKKGGQDLLKLDQVRIGLKWSKLLIGEVGFDEISIKSPRLVVESLAQSSVSSGKRFWNWQEFAHAVQTQLPPRDPQKESKPIKFSVDALSVQDASLLLIDQSQKLKEELRSFSFRLLELANYDQQGQISAVRGQYELNLGSLELEVPGVNKTVAFHHVSLAGSLDNATPNSLGIGFDLRLDEGKVISHWNLNTKSKDVEGKIQLENIATKPFIPLLPANRELQGVSGLINADLQVKLGREAEIYSGNVNLQDVRILEKGEKLPLISFDSADIRRLEWKSSRINSAVGSALLIDEVILDHPALRFEINDQGLSNFRRLFSKPQAEAVTHVVSDDASKSKNALALDIRTVNLKGGEVYFSDLAMRPNFKVDIKKFNASFLGVSNTPGRFASVAMDGVVAGSGSMRAKGQASFDDPRRNHDILMSFKNLPLSTFNPAVMTYAGYQITGGRLNLNLTYRAKDGQLNGSNQIVIKKVQLGDEVPDYQGKKLPLGLAIALLEDSDDTIDVTIRIAGNVDSPEFSATGLVWQAIRNVLTNVATAPFRALGSLLGMGDEEGVNALLGETVFLSADQERLEKFGDYIAQRPNSRIDIVGTYDPVQDKKEMARVYADAAILKEAGFKLQAGEPIPSPSLSDPRIQAGLKGAYAQYIGRIKLGQRLLLLPDGEARNVQLHDELIAGIEISEEDLKTLAKNRAQVAYDLMVKDRPELKSRVSVGGIRTADALKDGVPLDVELKTK
jgi:hypothetical protein